MNRQPANETSKIIIFGYQQKFIGVLWFSLIFPLFDFSRVLACLFSFVVVVHVHHEATFSREHIFMTLQL